MIYCVHKYILGLRKIMFNCRFVDRFFRCFACLMTHISCLFFITDFSYITHTHTLIYTYTYTFQNKINLIDHTLIQKFGVRKF